MANTKVLQFLDLTGLQAYDAKNKQYIDSAVAAGVSTSLKGVAISEGKLLFYTDYPIDGATPSHEIELPETDLSGMLPKFEAATAGNVVTVAEDGKTIVDSGKTLADYALASELAATTATADEAKAKVTALEALVGSIPEGYEATTIVAYVQEVAANIVANRYDDAELQAKVTDLQERATALEAAVTTLNGDENTEGSVKKTVADEIAKIVADAPESLDDLKEISDWITSHTTEAATMNSAISDNTKAIDALTAYVGTLPEDATAATVVDYIAEVLEDADLSQYALASDLASAIDRIAANENAIKLINASLAEGGTIYEMIVTAQDDATAANAAVQTLTDYVGAFVTDDESVKTLVQYIDAKVAKVNSDLATRVDAVEAALENKADKTDVEALEGRLETAETNIGTNTTDIAELQAAYDSIGAISEDDINALFA